MEKRISEWCPKSVLLIYHNGKEYYIEQSDVGYQNSLHGWKPLDEVFVKRVFQKLSIGNLEKLSFGGYIPPNVIGYGENIQSNTLMWRTEKQVVTLYFAKGAKMQDAKRIVPGLVWLFGTGLKLFAYKEWQGRNTVLYKPPFLNVTDSYVCLGTASTYVGQNTKRFTFEGVMQTVECAFWDSKFTHAGGAVGHDGSTQINGNFAALMEKTAQDLENYPYDYLVPIERTVKDIADEIFIV